MPNAQVSLVGRQPGGAIQGLRVPPPPEHLVLLHSDDPESTKAARRACKVAAPMLSRDRIQLVRIDPFGMHDVVRQITGIAAEHPEWKLSVNISGGTNIMASAALVACFMVGAEAFYVKEGIGPSPPPLETRIIRLPVPKVTLQELDARARSVLALCRRPGGGSLEKATSAVAHALGISPQLASYHLKRLARLGLIELATEGRRKDARLTDSGSLFAAVFQVPR